MKMFLQLSLIFFLSLLGELISSLLPFPAPGPIVAIILLFLLLLTKVIKEDWVKDGAGFLLGNMLFLFLPVVVKLMNYVDEIKAIWAKFLLLAVLSTFFVFFMTGLTVKLMTKVVKK